MIPTHQREVVLNQGFLAVLFVASILSGCAGVPMTPDEYRQTVKGGGTLYASESFEVQRPFAQVAQTFRKKAPECLSFSLGSRMEPIIGVGSSTHMYGTTKQSVVVSASKAELYFQVKFENTLNKEPEGGSYYLIADAYPVARDRTKVDIYRRKRVEVLPQAIRAWASGDNQGCPDQSKIINPKVF